MLFSGRGVDSQNAGGHAGPDRREERKTEWRILRQPAAPTASEMMGDRFVLSGFEETSSFFESLSSASVLKTRSLSTSRGQLEYLNGISQRAAQT